MATYYSASILPSTSLKTPTPFHPIHPQTMSEPPSNLTVPWTSYKLAMLKNKHKSVKLQAYMHDKEIAHLEVENEKEHIEAEKIHGHLMKSKKLDIEFLKEEGEVLHLKLELVKFQAGQPGGSLSSNGAVS
ncbi:hypothetical protein J3A83DRAFT_4386066 [Scleroderma citrinum]